MKKALKALCMSLLSLLALSAIALPEAKAHAASNPLYEASLKTSGAVTLYIGKPEAYVNNQKTLIDPANRKVIPMVRNNRTLVPVRFVSENYGAKVGWDGKTATVTITFEGKTIKLKEKSKKMLVNGKSITLDVPVTGANGRIMVPIRAVSEALGKNVFCYRNLIVISSGKNVLNPGTDMTAISEISSWFTVAGKGPMPISRELTLKEVAALEKSVVTVKAVDETGEYISQGSGFCIGPGLFLTNYHVVEGGRLYWVYTDEGTEYKAAGVVRYDEKLDLAILKTEYPLQVKPLTLGSKSMVEKGDRVVAIGSPLGLENTLSDGVVSSLRNFGGVDMIQMTAPITHGSSGSPLFNMRGHVVGINTLASDSGNLNFAVAIDYVKPWVEELAAKPFHQIPVLNLDAILMDPAIPDTGVKQMVYHALKRSHDEWRIVYSDESLLEYLEDGYVPRIQQGQLFRSDGTLRYEGGIVDGQPEGYGKEYYEDGRLWYEGEWKLGWMNGKGRMYRLDGSKHYEGDIKWGYPDGQGKLFYHEGPLWYEGGFQYGEYHGVGRRYDRSGNLTEEGTWAMGGLVRSVPGILDTVLDLEYTESMIHPREPVVYLLDKSHWRLYTFNYETGNLSRVVLPYAPVCMRVSGDVVYVGLVTGNAGEVNNSIVAVIDARRGVLKDLLEADLRVTPDRIHYFSRGGTVLASTSNGTEKRDLLQRLGGAYTDAVIDASGGRIFAVAGGGKSVQILDSQSLKGIGEITVNGSVKTVYYQEGKLIVLTYHGGANHAEVAAVPEE